MKHQKAIRRRRNPVDTSTIVFAIGGAAVAFGLYEWWKSSQTPAQTPAQAALVRTNAQIADITAKLAAAQAANDALGAAALQQTLTALYGLKASLAVA